MLLHSFRGPYLWCGLPCIWGGELPVYFVYLDEFGHSGPYMARSYPKYNENPAFGLAGIILPENSVRPFATEFLQLKGYIFADEIKRARAQSSHWEKKGIEIFTAKQVAKYPHFRSTGFRLLNTVQKCGGNVFYYGREKISWNDDRKLRRSQARDHRDGAEVKSHATGMGELLRSRRRHQSVPGDRQLHRYAVAIQPCSRMPFIN
jgi:hypothetical protein